MPEEYEREPAPATQDPPGANRSANPAHILVRVRDWRTAHPTLAKWLTIAGVAVLAFLLLQWYVRDRVRDAVVLAQVETEKRITAMYVARIDSLIADQRARQARQDSLLRAERARADTAIQRSQELQVAYQNLPRSVIERTPPQVLELMEGLQRSNGELSAALARERASHDSTRQLLRDVRATLDTARATITRQDTIIARLERVKTPRRGFTYYATEAGKLIIAALAGAGVASVLNHTDGETVQTPRWQPPSREPAAARCAPDGRICWRDR